MTPKVWLTALLGGLVTFTERFSFLAVAHRTTTLPPRVREALGLIPAAVLAALVVPALVRPEGTVDLLNPRLLAGVLAGLVTWRTRNGMLTLVVGMGALLLLEALLG